MSKILLIFISMRTIVVFVVLLVIQCYSFPITDTTGDTIIPTIPSHECVTGGTFTSPFNFMGSFRQNYTIYSYFSIYFDYDPTDGNSCDTIFYFSLYPLDNAPYATIAPFFAPWHTNATEFVDPRSEISTGVYLGPSPLDSLVGITSTEWFRTTFLDTTYYSGNTTTLVNTVQQITMTDGSTSISCFIYPNDVESGQPDGGISWNDVFGNNDEFSNARVGFTDGLGNTYEISDSGLDSVSSLDGVPGNAPNATTIGMLEGLYCFDVTTTVITPICNDFIDCTNDSADGLSCNHDKNNGFCSFVDPCTGVCEPELSGDSSGCYDVGVIDCNDFSVCTTDSCASGECFNVDIDCSDGDACTEDLCDPITSCYNPAIDCDDGNECTSDSCDSVLGCMYSGVDCNDNNACTIDSCDDILGCLNIDVICDDDLCTIDSCDTVLGCQASTPVICDDGDPCTIDICIGGYCVHSAIDCDDRNECTSESCNSINGECEYAPIDCEDGNACTVNTCDRLLGCQVEDVNCDDENPCTSSYCDSIEGCIQTSIICNDGNPCTIDYCDEMRGCQITWKDCDDNDPCTIDSCDENTGLCVNAAKVCDDGNDCTVDYCKDGECRVNQIVDCVFG